MKRTPLKRTSTLKRKTPLRARGKSSYARRPRDLEHMLLVKKLPCAMRSFGVATRMPIGSDGCYPKIGRCEGPVEADHAGERPLGRKCADTETIPLCSKHHRQRTDYSGPFKGWTGEEMRVFCNGFIALTQSQVHQLRRTA